MKLWSPLVAAGAVIVGGLAVAQDSSRALPSKNEGASAAATPQAEGCGCCQMMMGGDGKMMGRGKMMGQGGGMACAHMKGIADVRVEATPDGAVVRLTAKSPEQLAQVQQHALMMERCMSGMARDATEPASKK